MSMAAVMSQMPDVWRRVLAEHVADQTGRCCACSANPGDAASWPCQTYKVAHHARGIATGEFPIPTLQPSPSRAHSAWPLEQPSRRRDEWGGDRLGQDRWGQDRWGDDRWDRNWDRGGWEQSSWGQESWSGSGWSRDVPFRGEPSRDSWHHPLEQRGGGSARTFDRSYGSTVDAPYGSSFGVDDRRRDSW